MIVWLLAHALAAPPEGVQVDDAPAFESAALQLRHGPPGCWEVVGRASWEWDLGRRGGYAKGDAAFIGRLEGGIWHDFYVRSLGEKTRTGLASAIVTYPHGERSFVPLVGRFAREDGSVQNVLTEVLSRLGDDVSYAWSEWDEEQDAVILHRSVPFRIGSGKDEAVEHVAFPDGGLLPSGARFTFPDRFPHPDFRLAKVRDADARIKATSAGGMVFPSAEAFSFTIGFIGFQAHGAQTITYKSYRPCGGDASERDEPVAK